MLATGNGTATITAKATDGSGKSASCKVIGTVLVDKMWFEISPYVINAGWSVNQGFWYTPDNAKSTAVTWSSGNKQVATVSSDGTVWSNYNWFGTATITAKAKDGGGAWASYVVDVRFIRMDWARIYNPPGRSLNVGEGYGLGVEYGFTGDEASYPHFSWSSSDTSIATVNGGWVTAKKAGTVTITAYAQDGSGCTASCTINVVGSSGGSSGGGSSGGENSNNGGNNGNSSGGGNGNNSGGGTNIPVSNVYFDSISYSVEQGRSMVLDVNIKPSNATNKTIIWSSSDNSIATVDSNGKVKGIAIGTVKITAKAGKKSATCEVKVTKAIPRKEDGAYYEIAEKYMPSFELNAYNHSIYKNLITGIFGEPLLEHRVVIGYTYSSNYDAYVTLGFDYSITCSTPGDSGTITNYSDENGVGLGYFATTTASDGVKYKLINIGTSNFWRDRQIISLSAPMKNGLPSISVQNELTVYLQTKAEAVILIAAGVVVLPKAVAAIGAVGALLGQAEQLQPIYGPIF